MAYDNKWISPATTASDNDDDDLMLEFDKMINDIEMDKIGKVVKADDMPLPDKGAVVCDILEPSGIVCTPYDNGKTYVQIVEHLDPHISYIPAWLLDLVVRNMCYMILAKVRSAVEIVKKPCYQERMRDPNNAFYMYIRKRIEEDMPEEMIYVPPADGWKCI
ncbi:hypothetical protein FOL47_000273 [Perkinsus chesapeaki]|uniref:Uncharacterized protein n=1 Tax=Perkinsus chesapeaki TaxID=330153 RepID=A0A7J6MM42_PERCH|nr:hypothetical protein FOL47_000273 [Perkinsus chesapeaki]